MKWTISISTSTVLNNYTSLILFVLRHSYFPKAQQPNLTPNIDGISQNIHHSRQEPRSFHQRVDLHGGRTACTWTWLQRFGTLSTSSIQDKLAASLSRLSDDDQHENVLPCILLQRTPINWYLSRLCKTLQWLYGLRDGARVSSRVCGSNISHKRRSFCRYN